MKKKENFLYKSRVELLKALADETRLRILDLLKSGKCCQCDILPHVEKSQSTISQHIQILKDCNILDYKKTGQKVEYNIKDPRVFLILKIVDEIILEYLRKISELTDVLV
ncbi:MAG: ArsR/SmtB family transcription factor [Candidatus Jordarchaeum sp.]|uniref:ArsR/SmtB family transcription factor n=1 Tax=Candidatus Jordarchaeum sp. TaxID=2823881 RepID=UPI004049D63A